MKRQTPLLLIAFALCLPGCIRAFKTTVIMPEVAKPDPSLFGTWHGSRDGTKFTVTFGLPGEDAADGLPQGMVRAIYIVRKKDNTLELTKNHVFVGAIGKDRFLHLPNREVEQDGKYNPADTFSIFKYAVVDGHLRLWSPDWDLVAKHIVSGTIEGQIIQKKKSQDIFVTAGQDKLVAYFKDHGAAIFNAKGFWSFEKAP